MSQMTEHEIQVIVAGAVSETLLKLGIDAKNPTEMQADMRHLREWRQSVNTVKRQGLITAVGVITAGILGLIWLAIKGN